MSWCAWHRSCEALAGSGQKFAAQAFESDSIIHVVPGGQQFYLEADFSGPLQRLAPPSCRTPVHLLHKLVCALLPIR